MIICSDKIDIVVAPDAESVAETATSIIENAEVVTKSVLESGYVSAIRLDAAVQELSRAIDSSSQTLGSDLKDISETVKKTNEELNKRNEYIQLIDETIVLGKTGSPVTAVFTNESLQFLYNGQPVATFTNKVLQVHNIEVEHQVRFGSDWAIRPGTTTAKGHNLNIMWIGG